jgi:hypothetical protein
MGFLDATTGANPQDGRSNSAFDPGEGPRWPLNSLEIRRRTTSSRRGTPHWSSSDYQPSQVQTVASMDHELLVDNIVSVARLAKTFDLPVVLSTVNVANGQGPTIPELKTVLSDSAEIDRTEINS